MINIIQVGIGGMGNHWLETVLAADNVGFAGFVEANPAIADKQAARHNLDRSLIFGSIEDALRAVNADGVINVTPPQFHRPISIAALEAGIPVLCEKPLAGTMADARAIVDAANATGVLHMVAQNRRYSLHALTLKSVLSSGRLGKVSSASVDFFKGPRFVGFRAEMPYPLIIDMAIHHFDMMRFFLDSDPVSIYGRSWNPSWSWFKGDAAAAVVIAFANQAVVSYAASWCATVAETSWDAHWRFECDNGVVIMRDDQVCVHDRDDGAQLRLIPPVAAAKTAQAWLLEEFHQAITAGTVPITTCQDNLTSLAMVFDTVASFESGQAIRTG